MKFKWMMVLSILVFFIGGSYAVVILAGEDLLDEDKMEMSETSVIYDQQDKPIAKLFVENREYVTLDNIPAHLIDAFVVTEDIRFYEHHGIDLIGILRALYVDIRAGKIVEGGSTITQQLAKNTFLDHDRTFVRKIKEVIIALNLERKYTKTEILERYLNRIYFGNGAYGVQAAANLYFGKNVENLTLAESATLAALPKAPNTYSPFNNPDKAEKRRNLVLSLMKENTSVLRSQVTAEQIAAAQKEPLKAHQPTNQSDRYQAYIDYVVKEAAEQYGIQEKELYRGGYQIYTWLDPKVQHAMNEVYSNSQYFPQDGPHQKVESGMVVLDSHTGGITGMVGGREYAAKGLNRALIERQPGSSFKPIAVYAPALEKGWNPFDLLEDKRKSFSGYTPRNYDRKYRGTVTMVDAVRMSYNLPAVWLLDQIGVKFSLPFIEKFGIDLDKKDRNLAIALGGLTKGVSPLEMAQAYTTFVNHGIRNEAHAIRKIKDTSDVLIAEAEHKQTQVLSPQSAYYMHLMLEAVVQKGTGTAARIDRPVAGKTGTTQMPGSSGGNKDAWFVGYTPEYVGAVWIGFDRPDQQHVLKGGSSDAAKIFGTVMKKALKGVPVQPFQRPEGVEDLIPPVQLEPIRDLKGEFVSHDDQISYLLNWTPNRDKRVHYRIYRFQEALSDQKELLAQTAEAEFSIDAEAAHGFSYFAVPYDPESGREGAPSHIVKADLSLFQELFDKLLSDEQTDNEESPEKEQLQPAPEGEDDRQEEQDQSDEQDQQDEPVNQEQDEQTDPVQTEQPHEEEPNPPTDNDEVNEQLQNAETPPSDNKDLSGEGSETITDPQ
ncbi:transglycosylase domain-containing protein [Ammoniphilus sp. 3BR4]|uniref:transglycosylase domain-containing protein n=1 Tax=Ammoniphilus sp. 3BR4 TaxID=3158265 RepID=UPI0034667386